MVRECSGASTTTLRLPITDPSLQAANREAPLTNHDASITSHEVTPTPFAQRLIAWQRTHGRHDLPWQNTRDPYRIWLSEIMLQQTQVAAVIRYYERFLQRFPELRALAEATEDEVL